MNYILFVMALVSYTPDTWNGIKRKEWRPMGDFANAEACEKAAKELNFKEFKCINKYASGK